MHIFTHHIFLVVVANLLHQDIFFTNTPRSVRNTSDKENLKQFGRYILDFIYQATLYPPKVCNQNLKKKTTPTQVK